MPGKDQQIPIATVNENSKYSGMGMVAKKAGPPPGRRMSGSIDVICGQNSGSRRSGNSKENVIQVNLMKFYKENITIAVKIENLR